MYLIQLNLKNPLAFLAVGSISLALIPGLARICRVALLESHWQGCLQESHVRANFVYALHFLAATPDLPSEHMADVARLEALRLQRRIHELGRHWTHLDKELKGDEPTITSWLPFFRCAHDL